MNRPRVVTKSSTSQPIQGATSVPERRLLARMRDYVPTAGLDRGERLGYAVTGYVEFEDSDSPDDWHALLPALGHSQGSGYLRYSGV